MKARRAMLIVITCDMAKLIATYYTKRSSEQLSNTLLLGLQCLDHVGGGGSVNAEDVSILMHNILKEKGTKFQSDRLAVIAFNAVSIALGTIVNLTPMEIDAYRGAVQQLTKYVSEIHAILMANERRVEDEEYEELEKEFNEHFHATKLDAIIFEGIERVNAMIREGIFDRVSLISCQSCPQVTRR
jgi:hypothetical protein